MIGVYDNALKSFDLESISINKPYANELCLILKANIDQSASWIAKVEAKLIDFLQKGIINSKNSQTDGIFSSSILNKNLSLLSNLYQSALTQEDLDERDLLLLKQKIRTPQKPRCLRLNKPHEIIGKVLRWDENTIGPSISSKLHEVNLPPPSPFIPPPTPMSMAMELNNWFVDLIETIDNPFELVINSVSEYVLKSFDARTKDALEVTRRMFDHRNIGTISNLGMQFINENFELQEAAYEKTEEKNSKIEELSKFYQIVISRILNKEIEKNNNIEGLLMNEEFLRGIYSCCLEALLYLHSVVSINFEEVLDISGITAFDFWKVINSFSQFDTNIPQSLRRHFREIEVKIISHLSWKEGSKINSAIKQLIIKAEDSSDTNLFLRRLLSHSANRLLEICNSLGLLEPIKEEV